LSDIVNFLKSLDFWRNIMYQMVQLKMHGFWAILYVCQEMVPSRQ
jgi:ABC-type polysaccharide transport system permease subunit